MVARGASMSDSDKIDDAGRRKVIAEALRSIPFVGKLLAVMIEQRMWGWMLAAAGLVWFLLLYPLLVPLIAAWLVSCNDESDKAAASCSFRETRSWYAKTVRDAFRIDHSARAQTASALRDTHRRLDYFQVLDVRGALDETREWTLSARRGEQRVLLTVDSPPLIAAIGPPPCEVPKQFLKPATDYFKFWIGDTLERTVRSNTQGMLVQLDAKSWQQAFKPGDADEPRLRVRLVPVEALAMLASQSTKDCRYEIGGLRVTVEVFKDLGGDAQ